MRQDPRGSKRDQLIDSYQGTNYQQEGLGDLPLYRQPLWRLSYPQIAGMLLQKGVKTNDVRLRGNRRQREVVEWMQTAEREQAENL